MAFLFHNTEVYSKANFIDHIQYCTSVKFECVCVVFKTTNGVYEECIEILFTRKKISKCKQVHI